MLIDTHLEDPLWPRASDWLGITTSGELRCDIAVLGAPIGSGSISPGRCDLAPAAIREALGRFSCYDMDTGRDLRDLLAVDLGDANISGMSPEQALVPLSRSVSAGLDRSERLVILGGDNSVTRPGLHGIGGEIRRCALLTLDAHYDVRSIQNGLNNGNPISALLADGLPGDQIIQIGLQSFVNSSEYARLAKEAGLTAITMSAVRTVGVHAVVAGALAQLAKKADVIYVDIDMDVLDRADSPATPGSRPGGFQAWELLAAARLCGQNPKVRVIDIVEVDPDNDVANVTSYAAALCLLHFAAGVNQAAA